MKFYIKTYGEISLIVLIKNVFKFFQNYLQKIYSLQLMIQTGGNILGVPKKNVYT